MFIIIMNAGIGFWQEYNAEQTMEALRNMSSPTAQVIRDETRVTIPNNQAVPGDIMVFEDGDVIGADCRLFEVFNLETDEALLTGESLPVQKNLEPIEEAEQPLGDRLNMVFASTTVVKGRAKGIVTTTGMKTQIGKIATTLMEVDGNEQTPLQKRLNKMAYFVFLAAIILVVIVFAVHKFKYTNEVAIYAISVAIAIIPEGLVAVVTLTMAFGVRRMAEVKAIVRRLSSLESLGAVTNICSDKVKKKAKKNQNMRNLELFHASCPAATELATDGLFFEIVVIDGYIDPVQDGGCAHVALQRWFLSYDRYRVRS